jgi:hypothetical protein
MKIIRTSSRSHKFTNLFRIVIPYTLQKWPLFCQITTVLYNSLSGPYRLPHHSFPGACPHRLSEYPFDREIHPFDPQSVPVPGLFCPESIASALPSVPDAFGPVGRIPGTGGGVLPGLDPGSDPSSFEGIEHVPPVICAISQHLTDGMSGSTDPLCLIQIGVNCGSSGTVSSVTSRTQDLTGLDIDHGVDLDPAPVHLPLLPHPLS